MKLYTVAVNDVRMCKMEGDPGWNISREMNRSAEIGGWGSFCDLTHRSSSSFTCPASNITTQDDRTSGSFEPWYV